MSKFQSGDKVLINGALVATIQTYSEANNIVTYASRPPGGGTDTTTAHISQTRIERLVTETVAVPVEDDAQEESVELLPQDEITGSSSL